MSAPPLVTGIPTSIQIATPFSYGITTSEMIPSTLIEFPAEYTFTGNIFFGNPSFVTEGHTLRNFNVGNFQDNVLGFSLSGPNYSYSQISGKYVYIELPWVPDPTQSLNTNGRIRFGPFSFQLLVADLFMTQRTFNFYIKNLQGVDTFVLLGTFSQNSRRVYFERGISKSPSDGIVYYFEYMNYRATLGPQFINQAASFPIVFNNIIIYSKTFIPFTSLDRTFGNTSLPESNPFVNYITCEGDIMFSLETVSFMQLNALPVNPKYRLYGPFGIKNFTGQVNGNNISWWPVGPYGFLNSIIWQPQTLYGQYEIIDIGNGVFYRAKVDNLNKFPPANSTEWDYVGTSIPYRDYDYGVTTYSVGDYVRYLNTTTNQIEVYVCTYPTSGQPGPYEGPYNGVYWQLVPTPNNMVPFTITAPSTYTGEPAYFPILSLFNQTSTDLVPLVSGVETTTLTFSSQTGFQSIPTQPYQLIVSQQFIVPNSNPYQYTYVNTTYPITVLPVIITTTPTLTSPLSLVTYQPFIYNFSIPESLVNVSLRYNSNTTSSSIVPYISTGQYQLTFGSTEGILFTGSSRIVIEAVLNAIAIATSDTSIVTTNPFITITPSIPSGSLSLYKYEPFSYTFTTNSSIVGVSFKINRSSSEIQSFLTVSEDLQSVTFTGSFIISYTNTLTLVVDLVVGSTIIDSKTILITVGSGRFFPPAPNQNFQLYQYENISNTFGSNIEFLTVAPMTTILSSPSLPSGLTFGGSSNSFFLQGTPTLQVGQSNYQIIGSNSSNGRIITSIISLRVNPQQVRITPSLSTLTELTVGTEIDPIITTAIQPATSYQNTFRYTWTSLPDGLTFQNINGINVSQPFMPSDALLTIRLSGSPSPNFASLMTSSGENIYQTLLSGTQTDNTGKQTVGTSLFNFSLGETVLVTVSQSADLYQSKPLGTTDVLITAGSFFSSAIIESVTANSLPPGLSLVQYISPTVYRLTGTPTVVNLSGSYTFTATNTNGNTGSITASIPVNPDVVTFGGSTPANGTAFSYIVSQTVTPIVFSVTTSTITAIVYSSSISLENYGLFFNTSSGILSGTPTAPLSTTTVTITATNTLGTTATTTIVVTILPDVFTWPTYTPTYFQNKEITPFEFMISSTLSGRPILSYSSTDLPTGLFINPDGLLLGTPTVGSSGSFTIIASTGYTILTQVYTYTLIADQLLIIQNNGTDTVSTVFMPSNDNVTIAGGFGGGAIVTSLDGITWTPATSTPITSVWGIAWNGSYWVAVGSGAINTIATSPDGINWTGRGRTVFTTQGNGIAWNGSYWVAVGQGTNTIATSSDGITWTPSTLSPFTVGRGIAWNGSLWVAVGNGTNTIVTSSDGITWTPRTSDLTNAGFGIAWNGSYWVAVGNGLIRITTSLDGINWTPRSSPFVNNTSKVAWNGSLWIAIESSGAVKMASSPDGIVWTTLTSQPDININDITWNGSLWVVVGYGGSIIVTSPDGVNWTSRTSPLTFGFSVASKYRIIPSQGVQYSAIQYSSDSYVNPTFSIGSLSPATSATISVTPGGVLSGNFTNGTLNTTYSATLTAVYQGITSTRNVYITVNQSDLTITGNEYTRTITAASGMIITTINTIYQFSGFFNTVTYYRYFTSVPHGISNGESISVSGTESWANFSNTSVLVISSTEFRKFVGNGYLTTYSTSTPGRINDWVYYTTSIPHGLQVNTPNLYISGLTTSEFNISSATVVRVPSTTVFTISTPATGTAVTGQSGTLIIGPTYQPFPLTFTQPTQTTIRLFQYVPYSIPIQVIGTSDFIYYYSATIPNGFQLVKNTTGTTATLSGISPTIFNQTIMIYAKTYTGNAFPITISYISITPFFVNPQSGAGAYTALLRNDVEANAAQNARDNRTFPEVNPLAGPLMAPRAPDVITPDNCLLNLCKKPCPTCHTMM